MMEERYEITLEKLRETDAAIQVTDGDVTVWLPKSQIVSEEHLRGNTYEILLPEWLAHEKGLI